MTRGRNWELRMTFCLILKQLWNGKRPSQWREFCWNRWAVSSNYKFLVWYFIMIYQLHKEEVVWSVIFLVLLCFNTTEVWIKMFLFKMGTSCQSLFSNLHWDWFINLDILIAVIDTHLCNKYYFWLNLNSFWFLYQKQRLLPVFMGILELQYK